MNVPNSKESKDGHELTSLKTKNGPSESGNDNFSFVLWYLYGKLHITFDKFLCYHCAICLHNPLRFLSNFLPGFSIC